MRYRADIDGLRAIAVLAVIAFHYGTSNFASGGFVGVDVFFVISGYLITSILYSQIKSNTYSLINFYERRVRRIFPALFAMFAVCGMCSLALNFPSEVENIGKSIVASILFLSNVQFFYSSDYFDQKMEMNPLLHTWSLSVEEQFYIFFPLLLLALRPLKHSTRIILISIMALVSFAYSTWMVQANSTAAFYLVQFRAWELLIGSLLALGAIPPLKERTYAEGLGILGLAAIGASVVWISKETPFPGIAALPPCLGAAAILYSGVNHTPTLVSSLLSKSPIRFIGQISYSLYLWHWPVWVFYRLDHVPNNWSRFGLFSVCLLLAILSWRFIERPFRIQVRTHNARQTVKIAGLVMTAGIAIALLLSPISASQWKNLARTERTLAYANYDASQLTRSGTCFITSGFNDFNFYKKDECLKLKPNQKNVLLIGDSHAAHLWAGLIANYPKINFMQATASGCKPLMGEPGAKRCTDLRTFILRDFLPHHHLDGIILSARWAAADVNSVKATTAMLHAYADKVAVFGPIVEYEHALPRVLAKAGDMNEANFASEHRKLEPVKTDRLLSKALKNSGANYFSVYQALCQSQCVVRTGGIPIQFDYGHLTREGSALLASKVDQQLFSE
jgi:peptidoglycan/LPS O-acetylase OafA/YrhL